MTLANSSSFINSSCTKKLCLWARKETKGRVPAAPISLIRMVVLIGFVKKLEVVTTYEVPASVEEEDGLIVTEGILLIKFTYGRISQLKSTVDPTPKIATLIVTESRSFKGKNVFKKKKRTKKMWKRKGKRSRLNEKEEKEEKKKKKKEEKKLKI